MQQSTILPNTAVLSGTTGKFSQLGKSVDSARKNKACSFSVIIFEQENQNCNFTREPQEGPHEGNIWRLYMIIDILLLGEPIHFVTYS